MVHLKVISKAYIFLIGALVVVVLGVGVFALYRSSANPTTMPPYQAPSKPYSPSQPTTTPTQVSQNQITLTVSSPTNGQEVSTPTIVVTGKTVPNADVVVNETDLKADANGNFSITITLEEGDNYLLITASDPAGNFSEWEGSVTYTPAQEYYLTPVILL